MKKIFIIIAILTVYLNSSESCIEKVAIQNKIDTCNKYYSEYQKNDEIIENIIKQKSINNDISKEDFNNVVVKIDLAYKSLMEFISNDCIQIKYPNSNNSLEDFQREFLYKLTTYRYEKNNLFSFFRTKLKNDINLAKSIKKIRNKELDKLDKGKEELKKWYKF